MFGEFYNQVTTAVLQQRIENAVEERNIAFFAGADAVYRLQLENAYRNFRRCQQSHMRVVRLRTELAELTVRRPRHRGSTLVIVFGEDDMDDFARLKLGVDYEFLEVSQDVVMRPLPDFENVLSNTQGLHVNVVNNIQHVYNFVQSNSTLVVNENKRELNEIVAEGREFFDKLASQAQADNQRVEEELKKISAGIEFLKLNSVRDDSKRKEEGGVNLSPLRPYETGALSLKLTSGDQISPADVISRDSYYVMVKGEYKGKSVFVKKRQFVNDFTGLQEENFTREARMLQIINDRRIPGVVQSFGVDSASSPTALLIEHGTILSHFLKDNPNLSLRNKLSILESCASTFAILVESGILHRDIKPDNVMVIGNTVKIMNFGFVRAQEVGLSSGVTLRGTHSYVAPELLMSTSGSYQYSEATDMYSFAIMMNCVLTGVIPYEKYSHTQLIGLMYKSQGTNRPDIIKESGLPGNERVCQSLVALITMCWNVFDNLRLPFKAVAEQLKALGPKAVEEKTVLQEAYGQNVKNTA